MSDNLKVFQVFIASPNDLVDERRTIKEVADDLNAAFGKTVGLQIQLLGWEDRLPGFGRAQAQINEDVDKADLFVGFLWRRWGSDPGNPQFTSGFEEEFNRAVERRERSGSPEISLFFKDVSISSRGEVDEQLKRVLEFREKVASKKLLFGNFTNLEDWRKKSKELLHGHLLMLLKSMLGAQSKGQPQAPPTDSSQETSKNATGQKGKISSSIAKQQAIRVWAEVLDAIKQGELSRFRKSESLEKVQIARVGLVAAGMTNRDIEADLPAVHLANLLFKSRKQIELTQLEWLLMLRANLVPEGGYRPGWYWIRKSSLNVKGALVYFACHDEHQAVRASALDCAIHLGIPLNKNKAGEQSPIEVLCSHEEASTRKGGLEYLANHGTTKDLALVERMRADSDNDVRKQAEITRNEILLREDASRFFENNVLASPWISDEGMRAVQMNASQIDGEVLEKGLLHPDTKVRVFTAKELVARGLMPLQSIRSLKDGESVAEVFREYFLKAISENQKLSPKEIREALKPTGLGLGLFGHNRIDADEIIDKLFRAYTREELEIIANQESDDSPIAYRVLAEMHFSWFGEKVRADLKSDFAAQKDKAKSKVESLPTFHLSSIAALFGERQPDFSQFTTSLLV